jgi:predicted amidophosphoribosyltransferase
VSVDKRLAERLADVPGFGRCPACPYVASGPAELCYACARRSMEPLAPPNERCDICDRPFKVGEADCRNPLCGPAQRYFAWNFAIAMRSGVLERAINAYKFDGRRGWAVLFGRILAGFLEQQAPLFRDFDLIVASPTFIGPEGRNFDHTRLVLEHAAEEVAPGSSWAFDLNDTPAIIKTGPTESFTNKSYAQRRDLAHTELREALAVPDPRRTAGARILVYDDVFTDGHTLNEVARALLFDGNAADVCGVTLCRQGWKKGARVP